MTATTQAIRRAKGDTIKAMDSDRVGGYLVRFTNSADTDLWDEYFTKDSDFATEVGWQIEGKPILVEHGFDGTFKSMAVGVFDFSRIDDVGLYVEGKLKDREAYEEMLRELRANGKVAYSDEEIITKAMLAHVTVKALLEIGMRWSSGAVPQAVVVDRAGHIKVWPIFEGSMTVTPAEPDGTEVEVIRSAMKQLEDLLSIQASNDLPAPIEVATPEEAMSVSSDDDKDVETITNSDDKSQPTKEVTDMTIEEIKDMQAELSTAINTLIDGVTAEGEEPALDDEEVAEVQAELETEVEGLDADAQEALTAEELAEKAFVLIQKRISAKEVAQKAMADAAKAKVADWQKAQPPVNKLGGFQHSTQQRNISVSEDLRFANFSAGDMALAVKLAKSQFPELTRDGMTLGDIIPDEAFHKHMAMKISQRLEDKPFTGNDAVSMRAIMPFKSMKADELMATDITAQGDEWTSTFFVMDSWRAAEEANELLGLLRSRRMQFVTVPRGVDQVEFKTTDQGATMYTRNEPNSLDSTLRPEVTVNYSTPVTGKITKSLAEHVVAVVYSHRLDLQSLLNVAQEINWDVTQAMGEGTENALLNGDTETAASTNINLIDGTPAGGLQKPLYLAWNGLRLEALITESGQSRDGGALSTEDYLSTLALFPHRIQARKQQLLFIIDPSTMNATAPLVDIKTKDVAGELATLFTGTIPALFGVDIYTSSQLEKTDSAGKVTAAIDGTKGQIIAAYGPYCAYGRQQDIVIETARDIDSGATKFVANIYHVFMTRQANSVMESYNLTV